MAATSGCGSPDHTAPARRDTGAITAEGPGPAPAVLSGTAPRASAAQGSQLGTGRQSASTDGAPLIAGGDLATAPNLLSIARIVGVTAAVLLYFAGYPVATLVIGTVSCLTDHLDGYLARRLGQETTLGAMLDQAADSYTTAIALAMLVIAGGFRSHSCWCSSGASSGWARCAAMRRCAASRSRPSRAARSPLRSSIGRCW